MKTKTLLALFATLVAAGIMVSAVCIKKDVEKMDEFIAATDEFIAEVEKGKDYDKYRRILEEEKEIRASEQDAVEDGQASGEIHQPEVPETVTCAEYGDTESNYEGGNLNTNYYASVSSLTYEEFSSEYSKLGTVTWADCVAAAYETMGMDEYSLTIAAGWTVNECYTWYDGYLAYLCAMCPWYYYMTGQNMADGLAGWDYSGMYSEGNLYWLGQNISGEELKILYLAITHPSYSIYGCDGLSDYGYGCIYESYVNGYWIRIWSY